MCLAATLKPLKRFVLVPTSVNPWINPGVNEILPMINCFNSLCFILYAKQAPNTPLQFPEPRHI
jgi:hypothetical protein